MLRTVCATRYVTPLREGGSLPAIVEASDLGHYVLKFRGAGQGPLALVAEEPVPSQFGAAYSPSLAVDPATPAGYGSAPSSACSGATMAAPVGGFFPAFFGRIPAIALDPTHPETMYAASGAEQDLGETTLAKSTDGGKTWKRQNKVWRTWISPTRRNSPWIRRLRTSSTGASFPSSMSRMCSRRS